MDDELLTEDELLARLNALPGVQIERRNFGARIRPVLIEWQPARVRQAAAGRTQPYMYALRDLWQLEQYLVVRAELVRRGELGEKHAYSLADLEGIALLGEHDDIASAMYPNAQEAQEAGHAAP